MTQVHSKNQLLVISDWLLEGLLIITQENVSTSLDANNIIINKLEGRQHSNLQIMKKQQESLLCATYYKCHYAESVVC